MRKRIRFVLCVVVALIAVDAPAIEFDAFGPSGEGGLENGQTMTIGTGGTVFEIDAFLRAGAAPSIQLSRGAPPAGLELSFESELSGDGSDLTLRYRLENTSGVPIDDVALLSFLDVEIDEDINTFTNEYATVRGTLGFGSDDEAPDGFEVDEPGFVFGDLLENLQAGVLDNTNAVPIEAPDCVAMALSFVLGTVRVTERVVIEVMISEDGDGISAASFAITQSDDDPASTTEVTYSGEVVSREVDAEPGSFRRADIDGSSVVDGLDAQLLYDYLFAGGPASIACFGEDNLEVADVNDNESVGIADWLGLRGVVAGRAAIPEPIECGFDPDDDRRGFDVADPAYVIIAGDPRIVPPLGDVRDVVVPIFVRTPVALSGIAVTLEFDGSALTPFDPASGDLPFFASTRGIAESRLDAAAGRTLLVLYSAADGGTLVDAAAGEQQVGTLTFHIDDFALVRPFRWIPEGSFSGVTHRATFVDAAFGDHHPIAFSGEHEFVRGNSNNDLRVDISDPVFTLNWLFLGGSEPNCLDAADGNNDSRVDISDSVFTLNWLFLGGPIIPPPYPGCGLDAGPPDLLSCNPSIPCID